MKIEFLWFDDCPNHRQARDLLNEVMTSLGIVDAVREINATDPSVATEMRFPGSPTIRVDDVDIEPGYSDPGDYTPRCRLYLTPAGLKGVPDRGWLEDAFRRARGPSNPG